MRSERLSELFRWPPAAPPGGDGLFDTFGHEASVDKTVKQAELLLEASSFQAG